MNGATVLDAVETRKRTQLDRLGGTKWLVAATDANLETERVLAVTAASETAAAETFELWAESETDHRARETFASVAVLEREHAARIGEHTNDQNPELSVFYDSLRGLDSTPERVGGGLVGRPLVSLRTTMQVISFFVNEADERRADCFRDMRVDTEELLDSGVTLLDAVCDSEEEYERAQTAAERVVQIAYEEFVAALDTMGLDPRSIC